MRATMMGWRFCAAVGLVLALGSASLAQDQGTNDAALTEDLGVMSALVDQSVLDFYKKIGNTGCMRCHTAGGLTDAWGNQELWIPDGQPHANLSLADHHFGAIPQASNATYLEGVGVVIQLKAPSLPHEGVVKLEPTIEEDKPLSRWELMKRQLNGQSDNATLQLSVDLNVELHSRTTLAKQLIGLLAESGHNFRGLSPDERISVAITFVPSTYGRTATELLLTPNVDRAGVDGAGNSGSGSGEGGGGSASGEGGQGGSASRTDLLLVTPQVTLNADIFNNNIYGVATPKRPPVRMTITATKAQLDAVASGAISLDDFAKAVVVRTIDPHRDAAYGSR